MGDQETRNKNDYDRIAQALERPTSIVWSVAELAKSEQNHMLAIGPAALETALRELNSVRDWVNGLAEYYRTVVKTENKDE